MRKKIAIYSGVIPATSFIENLIEVLALEYNTILLFGRLNKATSYKSKFIQVIPTHKSRFRIVLSVFCNCILLLWQNPRHFRLLEGHIRECGLNYRQRLRLWNKYLPVVLQLPDVFHIQWAASVNEWMFLQKLFNVKIVVSLRGAQVNIAPIVKSEVADNYLLTFPEIDGFHAVSETIAKEAVKYGAKPSRVKVIYSGLNFDSLNPFQKMNYDIKNPVNIISVGRVHWKKGYNYAVDALNLLLNENMEFQLSIITDSLPEEILYLIEDSNIGNRVKVYNRMSQEKVFQLMQQADMLLLPSVEEGIANVVLEAMAIGLPVISSNCGGMHEVIDNGMNGVLFRNRDVWDLCKGIKSLISLDSDKRRNMALKAKMKVYEQHDLNTLGSEMNKLYKSILCE